MTTAVYIRVSTTGQNAASQKREIGKWLTGHGITDVVWFVDKLTGDNLKRPEFEKLQTAVFAGEVKTIVVYKLDRLSRSLRDGINTLTEWLESGVRVVSITQQLDFAGATGKLIASVLFAVAEMEQETRRERQAAGIAAARERGVYGGRKPGTTKGKPERAKELKAKGLTRAEIAASMNTSTRTVTRYLAMG
ncbi:recombinase family protein [Rhodopirellula halodulae]|uniref:recombinase family protein n=1 Tax=Rhodopirellula halodulae TaxID=2894198 RepID=UPI001E620F39|nr:recombinase family protein [Rhodopirellula sp. JC737]MCC9655609.1 recombinase family protein [Rhodopirellula sp. JC737]